MVNLVIDTSNISGGNTKIDRSDFLTPFGDIKTHLDNMLNGQQAFDTLLLNATSEAVIIDISGVATITRSMATLSANTGTADNLDSITIPAGIPCFIKAASGHTVTVRDNSIGGGNIYTISSSNVTLSGEKVLEVIRFGNNVVVIGDGASAGAGTGDVVGPASSTDNAVARWDGATGELLQDSIVEVDDLGEITGATIDADFNVIGNIGSSEVKAEIITGLPADATPNAATDYVMTYDADAAALKKVLLEDLPTGGGLTKVVGTATYTPGANITTTSSTFSPIDGTNIKVTVTLNGSGVTFCFATLTANKLVAGNALFRWTDGTNNSDEDGFRFLTADDGHMTIIGVFNNLPAGSTTFTPQFRSSDGNTVQIIQNLPVTMRVVELS